MALKAKTLQSGDGNYTDKEEIKDKVLISEDLSYQ